MKLIDKFLKKLNTSRNTFVTYVLTLISFYLAINIYYRNGHSPQKLEQMPITMQMAFAMSLTWQ